MTITVEHIRENDDLVTPAFILDRVRQLGPIGLDPCSNPWSYVRATIELSRHRGDDGPADPWATYLPVMNGSSLVFVNPPYSNPFPWAMRAVEAFDDGMEVVGLWKLDPSTKWSAVLRSRPRAVCDFHSRIRFDGGKYASGAMASTMTYHGPNPWLFCHVFQDLGEVGVRR